LDRWLDHLGKSHRTLRHQPLCHFIFHRVIQKLTNKCCAIDTKQATPGILKSMSFRSEIETLYNIFFYITQSFLERLLAYSQSELCHSYREKKSNLKLLIYYKILLIGVGDNNRTPNRSPIIIPIDSYSCPYLYTKVCKNFVNSSKEVLCKSSPSNIIRQVEIYD
jgi:hypothetical protein